MLKGIHCPFKRVDLSFEECIECSRSQNNPCSYPTEVIKAILSFNEEEQRKGTISVTSITGCPRSVFLRQTNDYYEKLEDLYYSFRGQLFHGLCEKHADEGAIVEKRFWRTVGDTKISGKMDIIYPEKKLLRDHKSTKMVPKRDVPYKNHIIQLNVYRWILEKPDNEEPIPIETMKVTYYDMKELKTVTCPYVSNEEIEKLVVGNAGQLQAAYDYGEVPDVPEEYPTYWQCNGYCPVQKVCAKIWRMGKNK